MAGIYSQGGSAGHRYAGWLSKVEAKNFHFGGKVFNGSPSAIYVGSNLVWMKGWLKGPAVQAIMAAFGVDGTAVIAATNEYLNGIAASDKAKATALAGFINEDPMMVCSLGLEPQGVTMPKRSIIFGTGDGVDTGLKSNDKTILKTDITFTASSGNYQLGSIEGGDSKDWRAFDLNGTLYWDCGSARITRSLALNTRHTLEIGNNYTIVDGSKNTGTTQSASAIYANTIYIGYGITLHDVAEVYDGTDWHRIVPSEQDGVIGMIDFADMSFHAATGTPTIPDISYTPTP